MLEILGGTSDGDLLEVVSNLHASIQILTIPQKLILHVFLVNTVDIPQKRKDHMNEYVKMHARNQ